MSDERRVRIRTKPSGWSPVAVTSSTPESDIGKRAGPGPPTLWSQRSWLIWGTLDGAWLHQHAGQSAALCLLQRQNPLKREASGLSKLFILQAPPSLGFWGGEGELGNSCPQEHSWPRDDA